MKNQTGRKIKLLQFDHIREYKDQFLQFGQNNGMKMHFTIQKDEIAKKIICALLEKVRYLLYTPSLDKSFWVEFLVYANRLMNRLSSAVIGGKSLLDIWSNGVAEDFSLLRIFGCPIYFGVKNDKSNREQKNLCFSMSKKIERLQAMRLRKQEKHVELACYI